MYVVNPIVKKVSPGKKKEKEKKIYQRLEACLRLEPLSL
jgi:hypothetical protein